ncbi:MAG: DUF427 domain-containing protein [Stellaceae bacterium]
MVKAVWNGETIADSDQTVVVEGNHYFPQEKVNWSALKPSASTYTCPWKGDARYFTIVAGGKENVDAAWTYPDPKPAAALIKGRIAFWKGVQVS